VIYQAGGFVYGSGSDLPTVLFGHTIKTNESIAVAELLSGAGKYSV